MCVSHAHKFPISKNESNEITKNNKNEIKTFQPPAKLLKDNELRPGPIGGDGLDGRDVFRVVFFLVVVRFSFASFLLRFVRTTHSLAEYRFGFQAGRVSADHGDIPCVSFSIYFV